MAITRIEAEQILTQRMAGILTEADMLADDTPSPWLTDALRWSLAALGAAPASYTAVTDADLALLDAAKTDALLDLAELRTLEIVQANLTAVDVVAGPLQEKRSQLATALGEMIAERRKVYGNRYAVWLELPLSDEAPKRARLRVL